LRRFGSKGWIFSHWASVSSRRYRAIGPPLALLSSFIACFGPTKHQLFSALYPVLKEVPAIFSSKERKFYVTVL
jgi:hypothetical protein